MNSGGQLLGEGAQPQPACSLNSLPGWSLHHCPGPQSTRLGWGPSLGQRRTWKGDDCPDLEGTWETSKLRDGYIHHTWFQVRPFVKDAA